MATGGLPVHHLRLGVTVQRSPWFSNHAYVDRVAQDNCTKGNPTMRLNVVLVAIPRTPPSFFERAVSHALGIDW